MCSHLRCPSIKKLWLKKCCFGNIFIILKPVSSNHSHQYCFSQECVIFSLEHSLLKWYIVLQIYYMQSYLSQVLQKLCLCMVSWWKYEKHPWKEEIFNTTALDKSTGPINNKNTTFISLFIVLIRVSNFDLSSYFILSGLFLPCFEATFSLLRICYRCVSQNGCHWIITI